MRRARYQSIQKGLSNTKPGFTLIEIVLASSVFALIITASIGSLLYGQESTALAGKRARAAILAEEGLEAVRNIRDSGTTLTDGIYGLSASGSTWQLSGSQDVQDIFTRQITIETIDTYRKQITSQITWSQNLQRNGILELTTRLTDWQTETQGPPMWTNPNQIASVDLSGNQDALKVQVSGDYAYVVRGNASPNFSIIQVSTPSLATEVAFISLTGAPTNIAIAGNYAYVTNSNNAQELQIIDISNPLSPIIAGTYNSPGNANANDIVVIGSYAYMIENKDNNQSEFEIIDISNPAIPTLVGSIELGDAAHELAISGNYAYIASSANSEELQVVDISNPASPSLATTLDLATNDDAVTISISGQNAFIGQADLFRIIDISSPTSPTLLGSISAGDTINDISLTSSPDYAFIATSNNDAEMQMVNITTSTTPIIDFQVDLVDKSAAYGIAYDETLNHAFVATDINSQEFVIIAPE